MKIISFVIALAVSISFSYLTWIVLFHEHAQCAGERARLGMSKFELVQACGKPIKINSDITAGHAHDQFVYSRWPTDYVYLRDGIVDSMQWEGK